MKQRMKEYICKTPNPSYTTNKKNNMCINQEWKCIHTNHIMCFLHPTKINHCISQKLKIRGCQTLNRCYTTNKNNIHRCQQIKTKKHTAQKILFISRERGKLRFEHNYLHLMQNQHETTYNRKNIGLTT